MSIYRHSGGSSGSQGPLHLPSDDLPRVDREKAPEGRPGPSKLQGDPVVVLDPSYRGEPWGGRRTPARKPKS